MNEGEKKNKIIAYHVCSWEYRKDAAGLDLGWTRLDMPPQCILSVLHLE